LRHYAVMKSIFSSLRVVIRGGGDLASGVIYRLARIGFQVLVTELPKPTFVRRTVSFGEAIYSSSVTIEGITADRVDHLDAVATVFERNPVAVMVDEAGECLSVFKPHIVIDARMFKQNLGTRLNDAPVVIALGPGFIVGVDCHAVIETNRGHYLGHVIERGTAEPDTGEPGVMGGHTHSRVLRAPASGYVQPEVEIGDLIQQGMPIASVNGQAILAAFDGMVRGLIHPTVWVEAGWKIGDLDPRAQREACFTISDKSLAVGGGVVEAILAAKSIQVHLSERYETAKSL
jgi:xanthine dehydrogenase accessory factor